MSDRRLVSSRRANGGSGAGRMPQAPASLLVQLPPDELKYYAANPSALAQLQRSGPSTQRSPYLRQAQGVQPTDIALLAASIQERRVREAQIFTWQQRLIGGGNAGDVVSRELLKRALTQLSLSAWLQVLQERHLAHRCAYPTCSKRPKKPHLSHQPNATLPLDTPRYRISLRRRTIERDERDDAGGQHSFCSNTCWRRGEWVSRWVLNGGQPTRQAQRAVSDEAFGTTMRDVHGLGEEVEQGGRWERTMDEEHWTEIELLEDLEDKGEVDRLSDNEEEGRRQSKILAAASSPISPVHAQHSASFAGEDVPADDEKRNVLHGQADAVARMRAKQRAQNKGTAEGFLNMLDSLVIQERTTTNVGLASAPPVSSMHISLPSEKDDIVGEFSALPIGGGGGKGGGGGLNMAQVVKLTARQMESDGQLDRHGDVSMSDDTITTDDDDEVDGQGDVKRRHRRRRTEEERTRLKEEDDLFAQAWQAMSEEKAKGTWEE